jgi:hypothetical protein
MLIAQVKVTNGPSTTLLYHPVRTLEHSGRDSYTDLAGRPEIHD